MRHPAGAFEAHFDNRSQDASFDNLDVEALGPRLTARTIDVEALRRGTPLDIEVEPGRFAAYQFDKHEPDGRGESRILLSAT